MKTMKKLMMIALAATMFCACVKENETVVTPQTTTEVPVRLSFGNADAFTRAYFDDTMEAEPWEKAVNTVTVYVFNSIGRMVKNVTFSADDLAAMSTEFTLPVLDAGEVATFQVIANRTGLDISSLNRSAFYARTESDISSYNGTFAEVSTKARRQHGFAMSGTATATMKTDGTVTEVSVTLKRVVAKIAVKIAVDPTFPQRHYGGTIAVKTINVVSVSASVPLLFNDYYYSPGYSLNHTQTPQVIDGEFCSLFYVFEQGPPAFGPDQKARIDITAELDQDGNPSTNDRMPYRYSFTLEGSGDGEIKRNGYYRVTGTITDLDVLPTISSFDVSEWEVPSTSDAGDIIVVKQ